MNECLIYSIQRKTDKTEELHSVWITNVYYNESSQKPPEHVSVVHTHYNKLC